MAVDIDALRTEIQQDPQGLGYGALMAAGDRAGTAALLNAQTVPNDHWLEDRDLKNALENEGVYAAMLRQSEAPAGPISDLCLQLVDGIRTGKPGEYHLENPQFQAGMAGLVAGGVMTQAQADNVAAAFGLRYLSRAEELWGSGTAVTEQDLSLI